MPDKMTWFEAREVASDGTPIRREAWRRWVSYRNGVFLWVSHSEGQPKTDTEAEAPAIPERVVWNEDFGKAEFLAHDWTDRHWLTPPTPDPITPPGTGDGSTPTTGGGTAPGTGGGSTPTTGGAGTTPGTGGGWGGGGNPPGPGGENEDGPGSGGSTGGGGNNDPTTHPDDDSDGGNTPKPSYTPTVSLTLDPGDLDGPGCFIEVPQEGKAAVTVSLPNPPGGTLKLLTISVSCLGETKLGTIAPGGSQDFQFSGPINPGGTVTATATASGGTGRTWTGTDTDTWPKVCLLPRFTWGGERTIVHSCDPPAMPSGDPPPTGYNQEDKYSTTAQYAVNPEPGAGKTGTNTGTDFNLGDNWTTKVTPFPDGTTTTTTAFLPAPGSITCDVSPTGAISNVIPARLNIFAPGANGSVTEGTCTTTTSGSETGP